MDTIAYAGFVCDGTGNHKKLGVPGRHQLKNPPLDWPIVLYRGSLNIRLDSWPTEFHSTGRGVACLDDGQFAPEFEIGRDQFELNLLVPREGVPRGGDAQVWRANVIANGERKVNPPCWVLRRFGARVGEQLELVSGDRLRDAYALENGMHVEILMFGTWRTS